MNYCIKFLRCFTFIMFFSSFIHFTMTFPCRATDVPVGDDQVKHIELTKHLAKVFNRKYGFVFPKPQSITGQFPRIKSLRNPEVKMSKSDPNSKSRIELTDTHDVIQLKFRKAVTDFTHSISYDPDMRPGVSNLVEIHASVTAYTPEEVCKQVEGLDTVQYKELVAQVVNNRLAPIREEINRLQEDKGFVENVLRSGANRAREIASDTYLQVLKAVGFR